LGVDRGLNSWLGWGVAEPPHLGVAELLGRVVGVLCDRVADGEERAGVALAAGEERAGVALVAGVWDVERGLEEATLRGEPTRGSCHLGLAIGALERANWACSWA